MYSLKEENERFFSFEDTMYCGGVHWSFFLSAPRKIIYVEYPSFACNILCQDHSMLPYTVFRLVQCVWTHQYPRPNHSWICLDANAVWCVAHVGSRASSVIIILDETSLTTRKYCADCSCQLPRWKYQYYSMHYHKTMLPSLSRGNTLDLWPSLRIKIGIKRIKCHFLYNLVIYKAILSDGIDYFSVVCDILHKNYQ